MNIVAKTGVWPKLQELLGDNFHTWLNSVEKNMTQYEFIHYRRNGDKLYLVPVSNDYEVILNIRKNQNETNCFESIGNMMILVLILLI